MKKRTVIDLILLGLFGIAVGAGIYILTASKEPRELLVKADHVRGTVLDLKTDAEKRVEVDDPVFMLAFLDALLPLRAMERVYRDHSCWSMDNRPAEMNMQLIQVESV